MLSMGGLTLPALADTKVAWVEIEGEIAGAPKPFSLMGEDPGVKTLRAWVDRIDALADRSDIEGVLIRLKDATLDRATIDEVGQALDRVRESGKKVHVYAEGYGTGEFLLGSHADELILQSGGAVSLPGLYMEEMFLADTLAWAGAKAQLVQIGDYKGANEMMTRSAPSEAWSQNIDQLLDSMYAGMRERIKKSRKYNDKALDDVMRSAWMATGEEAMELGLIDALVDLPDLRDHLGEAYGDGVKWDKIEASDKPSMDFANPFAMFSMFGASPERKPTRDTIAIVHVNGTIVDGDSTYGGLFGGGASAGSRTLRNALEKVRGEDLIKGVIVRIDSPGGSAIASEVIWQGLRRVAEEKPVWVSVGSMAASGGYYIAVGSDRIYVNDSSIVGSIGVVGGKIAMEGVYDTLKVHVVGRARGPMADMFGSAPWTEQQLAMIRDRMKTTYDLFASRVQKGRRGIDLSKTAEGRLFTGDKAVKLKMADEVGTLHDAIGDMAERLSLGTYDVMDYPQPMGLEEFFEKAFGDFASAQASIAGATGGDANAMLERFGRAALGDSGWDAVQHAAMFRSMLEKEGVLTIVPAMIRVK
jgi:protease-4